MRKIGINFLAFLILLTLTLKTNAQGTRPDNSKPLQLLGVGIGFGSNYQNISYDHQTPMINVLYEHEVYRFDDIGIITAGGQLGFRSYKNSDSGFEQKWFWVIVSGRGLFHVTALKVPNLDVYGGVALTYYFLNYTDNYNSSYNYGSGYTYDNNFGAGAFAGGRYYFSDKFSAFGELGFGATFFNTGISFKL